MLRREGTTEDDGDEGGHHQAPKRVVEVHELPP